MQKGRVWRQARPRSANGDIGWNHGAPYRAKLDGFFVYAGSLIPIGNVHSSVATYSPGTVRFDWYGAFTGGAISFGFHLVQEAWPGAAGLREYVSIRDGLGGFLEKEWHWVFGDRVWGLVGFPEFLQLTSFAATPPFEDPEFHSSFTFKVVEYAEEP